jgi:outer membrane receptor protein involved in Fe transport
MNLFYDFIKVFLSRYDFTRIRARHLFLVSMLTLFALNICLAQNVGKISGVLKDTETGEPLIGCNITILETNLGAVSDPDGAYFVLNIPPGKYNIQASLVGYQKVLQRGVIVNAGRTTNVDFKLKASAVEVGEVVVEATRPDVEKEKTSTSAIIRFDDVQQMAGIRDVGDVIGLAADVTDGHFRGGREGEEYYTLQGMGIVNPLDNSTAFLPIMSAVEEVEVITSGFGAQYGNAQSGVVNISMKEGKPDKWRTRFEARSRAPGRKHFGPSVYDPSANPYLATLLNRNSWFGEGEQTTYYESMWSGKDFFAADHLVQYQVARTLWEKQTKRDLYRKYGQDIDYSVEGSADGPIDENMRMFMAIRANNEWPVFPTEQPNIENQIMGNIVTDISKTAALRLSGGFTQQNTNVYSSSNTGYFRWLWDRIAGIRYQKRNNLQLGAKFTHTLSPNTFYEIKISSLWTKNKIGSTVYPDSEPDSSVVRNSSLPLNETPPDKCEYLLGDTRFVNDQTRTVSLDASITNQMTKHHLLNGGIQMNSYNINVNNRQNMLEDAKIFEEYDASPFEAAIYAQDKMEFEGMIANVGLRFDIWDVNILSYPLFSEGIGDIAQAKTKTPILYRLQPRIGVSFPVSELMVFHLNYGTFLQRPSFQYLLRSEISKKKGGSELNYLGNPRLKPEETHSYDIGLNQGFGEGFTLDVSGYYKDVKNLVEQATLGSYTTWFNRDYADIRGFRVALVKRKGSFTGSVNYQYGYATGKSATTSNAPVSFTYNTTTHTIEPVNDFKVPVRDVMLAFDRTHNVVISLGYTTEKNWGPEIFGGYPFDNLTLSSNSFLRSGRPYTSKLHSKLLFASRTPAEYNTNIRLTKKILGLFGTNATLYFEIFNLFNNKILNYDYIFAAQDASTPNTANENYEKYPINDPAKGILYWPIMNNPPPWAIDQSFMIYSNTPRSYNLGFVVEF